MVLLHLSDIHFNKGSDGVFDLDSDLRDALERDLLEMIRETGPVTSILVTGDVAFSGQAEEYLHATKWLTTLTARVGCHPTDVWTIPGNHDVNREELKSSKHIRTMHSVLKSTSSEGIDREVRDYLEDAMADVLLKPLENYMNFAEQYECGISPLKLFWEQDFYLSEHSTLRIRGINSAWVSNSTDNTETNKLVVSKFQTLLNQDPAYVNVIMCHHPPHWLVDRQDFERTVNNRSSIQLYGHEHDQQIRQVGKSVQVFAGAVHPSRGDREWNPCYNLMSITEANSGEQRKLMVEIWGRQYNKKNEKFQAFRDYNDHEKHVFELQLPPLSRGDLGNIPPRVSPQNQGTDVMLDEEDSSVPPKSEDTIVNSRRILGFHFAQLSYPERLKIASELDLVVPEDETEPTQRLTWVYIKRALQAGKAEQLWNLTEEAHPNGNPYPNPFASEDI